MMEGGGGSVGKCRERDGELKETNCSVALCLLQNVLTSC